MPGHSQIVDMKLREDREILVCLLILALQTGLTFSGKQIEIMTRIEYLIIARNIIQNGDLMNASKQSRMGGTTENRMRGIEMNRMEGTQENRIIDIEGSEMTYHGVALVNHIEGRKMDVTEGS